MSAGAITFHERYEVYVIAPQTEDGSTASSAWIPMHNALEVVGIVNVGVTDVDVNAKFEQDKDGDGGDTKDVKDGDTTVAITEIADDADSTYATLQFSPSLMDTDNGFYYARLSITADNGTDGALVSGVVLVKPRHMPASQPEAHAEQATFMA